MRARKDSLRAFLLLLPAIWVSVVLVNCCDCGRSFEKVEEGCVRKLHALTRQRYRVNLSIRHHTAKLFARLKPTNLKLPGPHHIMLRRSGARALTHTLRSPIARPICRRGLATIRAEEKVCPSTIENLPSCTHECLCRTPSSSTVSQLFLMASV